MQLHSPRGRNFGWPGKQLWIRSHSWERASTLELEQAADRYPEYGQGAQGYAKRFAAGYADAVSGIFIGNAILPSLLKQDPRYFYKGTGTTRSRTLYAIASPVICKGDNKRWQPNYSYILGSIAAGGISTLYVPTAGRNVAGLIFENALIRIGEGSSAVFSRNLFFHD